MAFEVSCVLEGEEYPFDKHACKFQIKSCKSEHHLEDILYSTLDYHDKHSITCSSQLRSPEQTGVQDIKSLQHLVIWDNLTEKDKTVRLSTGYID